MILSDRTIREELAAGRIVIDPLDEGCIQPSSVDLHVDRYFRVFLNHTMGHIDVKENLEDLTQLVEIPDDGVFMLHPGEFVLGSTRERVALPDDLVARLEGKSSLGRLGLLIHSSLPGSEPVAIVRDGQLVLTPIENVVRKRVEGAVIGFDPDTFSISTHPITGWYEGPADRIYEVRLASGRSVRVTAGHALFSIDRRGNLIRLRTLQLRAGSRVAIPRRIPDPGLREPVLDLRQLVPEVDYGWLVVQGPTVRGALVDPATSRLLRDAGYGHADFYADRGALPLGVARQVDGLIDRLGEADVLRGRGARRGLPVVIPIDDDIAWLLGLFVAEGYRRRNQVVWSNTDPAILDRVQRVLARLGQPVCRAEGVAVTCSSRVLASLLGWLGTGGHARTKRLPIGFLGWPDRILRALWEGLLDGDGSWDPERGSYSSCSPEFAADVLLLTQRLGRRAAGPAGGHGEPLVRGGLTLDTVVEVIATDRVEPVYDLEVRPAGRRIENFLAGSGGVFVSNTAGFVDAGWDGHLTLELSNVANLPIALYPGMKIGQISFLRMTTPADVPYGSAEIGSKYQGQRGPTPSRYWENFRSE